MLTVYSSTGTASMVTSLSALAERPRVFYSFPSLVIIDQLPGWLTGTLRCCPVYFCHSLLQLFQELACGSRRHIIKVLAHSVTANANSTHYHILSQN